MFPTLVSMARNFNYFLVLTCCLTGFLVASGDLPAAHGGEDAIELLRRDIKYLSSDSLEGRGIGTKGLDLAADYIRDQFKKAGLKPVLSDGSYFQPLEVPQRRQLANGNKLMLYGPDDEKIAVVLKDQFVPLVFSKTGSFDADLVFAGYGITAEEYKYDDYAGIDVKGKIVLIMRHEPAQSSEDSEAAFDGSQNTRHAALSTKAANAAQHGAAGVIFVNSPYSTRESPDELMEFGYAAGTPQSTIPLVQVSQSVANRALQAALSRDLAKMEQLIDKTLEPNSATLEGWRCAGTIAIDQPMATVKNVVGMLPAAKPETTETLVVGAHYDHLGYGDEGSLAPGSAEIHNGADDNASGTVGVLELVRRLSGRKDLKRRILFMAFTAEERGLLGSRHYVEHPAVPLTDTIAMVNMDMIGRLKNGKLIVYGTGSAKEFKALVDRHGSGGNLDIRHVATGFGPSDQTSFYMKKIPVLHFFTDLHPDYHRPGDDWDKVEYAGMEQVLDLIEQVVVDIANADGVPSYVAVAGGHMAGGRPGGGPRAYLGSIPAFGETTVGVLLDGVAEGGPAATAGLRKGDVMIKVGSHDIRGLEDLQAALQEFDAGDRTRIVVRRGTNTISYPVKFGRR